LRCLWKFRFSGYDEEQNGILIKI